MSIQIHVDQKGFVHFKGIKLPFKYKPQTDEIEFRIKDKYDAAWYGSNLLAFPLADLQILPLLYGKNKLQCDKCPDTDVKNFKATIINENELQLECLVCNNVFSPRSGPS